MPSTRARRVIAHVGLDGLLGDSQPMALSNKVRVMTAESDLASAAAAAAEVDLTTFGRRTGRPSRNTVWITSDAQGRIHIHSGRGLVGDWPQNLLANGRAI